MNAIFQHPKVGSTSQFIERKRANFKAGLQWCEVGYPVSYLNDAHRRMLMNELEAKGLVEVVYVLTPKGEEYNRMTEIPDEILEVNVDRTDARDEQY